MMAKNAISNATKQISNFLMSDKKKIKYLIVGPPRSGKTTLFQQLKRILINDGKIEEKTKIERRDDIRKYVIDSITVILTAITLPVSSLKILAVTEWLKHNLKKPGCFEERSDLPKKFFNLANFFNFLWQDEEMKSCLLLRIYSEYRSRDNLEYFFDKIEVIFNSDYVPTEEDVLRCPFFSSDVEEIEIHDDDCVYKFIDTGNIGRRLMEKLAKKRQPYLRPFQNQSLKCIVIVMIDCSSPDQLRRSLNELNYFIRSSDFFYHKIYAIANKVDVFKKRILSDFKTLFWDLMRGCCRYTTVLSRSRSPSNVNVREENRQLDPEVLACLKFLTHILRHVFNLYKEPTFRLIRESGLNGYSYTDVINYLEISRLVQNSLYPGHKYRND